ncbi:unnamed protein product [Meloidogyne enterolobii]|uniref:Pepsin inhibitor-3-like repeated domain-containing protein n=2 Tax=Meloidogyne enterolobii TaxID=390850 RepID=A0A6V7Y4P8_MELEN|nr:unnamed protein product [Meloidogyne enterolobii]
MMRKLVILLIYLIGIFFVNADLAHNSRARRFCCGGVSTFQSFSSGGSTGCVVSDNKLYINGIFTKDLNPDEVQELEQYKNDVAEYRNKSKKYFEDNWNAPFGGEEEGKTKEKAPEPPKSPSFCGQKARTQFVFNGCMVQGDSLYIGNNFVRKLNESEQKELEEFDEKLEEYQKALNEQINRQVSESFGKSFGRFFGKKPFDFGSDSDEIESTDKTSTLPAERKQLNPSKSSKLEMPKPPEFCTIVA